MKKLGSLVVLSLAAVVAVLFISANSVKASSPYVGGLNLNPTNNTVGNTTGTPATPANETNNTTNTTPTVDPNAINTTKDNNINDNLTKNEISKTGEFDTYIISGVAIAVIAVGSVAFIKSRKLD